MQGSFKDIQYMTVFISTYVPADTETTAKLSRDLALVNGIEGVETKDIYKET
jgi:hypothetical protein